tara:strand:+ start:1210 stop:2355 length:1146 start_codon:yes stop_codon:yes gene_type:complete
MSSKKKIIFVTGSRSDYGKMKSIILKMQRNRKFDTHVFVTGMHNILKYGDTWREIKKDGIKNIYRFNNQVIDKKMDNILANTIKGFSKYIINLKPDLIVVHGDRIEPLACAIVGCLNNLKIAHIEGGDVSGTVDESLRHSISKLSNLHFVSNKRAKKRLIQMGEYKKNIFEIGSPDLDILLGNKLPSLETVKKRYKILFGKYAICVFHPVTTEFSLIKKQVKLLLNVLKESKLDYVLILPNNDSGSEIILKEYQKLKKFKKFRILPSMRFEHYLTLLKNSKFIIGNSSSAIIEAPYYNIFSINIGTRQKNRFSNIKTIYNLGFNKNKILNKISYLKKKNLNKSKKNLHQFGKGNSADNFLEIIKNDQIWRLEIQKNFVDIK